MRFNLSQKYRHFQRYQEIAQILFTNGLGFIVDRLDLKKFLPFKKRLEIDGSELNKKTLASRFRSVLQELGPTFIKLGQLMSTRPDIFPPDFIKELRKLQDQVDPLPFSQLEEVLEDELGENFRDNFRNIDKKSRAAASIAQTHHAVMDDGSNVILKIQRPKIQKKSKVDMEILYNLAEIAKERELFPDFIDPVDFVTEFRDSLMKELDFRREVSNMDKFRNNFADNPQVKIPHVYKDLSGDRLIVMEEIKGIQLNEINPENVSEVDTKSLADLGARVFMKQIFIDGFFHADPHPGNIFIVEQDKLAYIDFGLVGQLTDEVKTQFSILFFALMYKDSGMIVDIIMDIGVVPPEVNSRKVELEVKDLINKYYGRDLGEIDFMSVFDDFQRILYKFNIRMPQDFFLLIRAMAVSEGVGYLIDPSFNIVEVGQDFLPDLLKSRLSLHEGGNYLFSKLWKLRNLTHRVPGKLGKIIDKVINNNFTINFKHQNLENLINKLDIISNRLSISLIISALIISSSVILHTEMSPMVFNIPLLGFVGYILAGILGFLLVIAIIRSGRF
ncbi:MAG: ABC1 kinase family protein [bacterium]